MVYVAFKSKTMIKRFGAWGFEGRQSQFVKRDLIRRDYLVK